MGKGHSLFAERVLFVTMCVLLLCQYLYIGQTWIMEGNPQFTLLEPSNASTRKVDDNYGELMDLKNFTFLINSPVCSKYNEGILLIIIVSSNPKNCENRDLIRKTWGQQTKYAKLLFLMGVPPDSVTLEDNVTTLAVQIHKESVQYQDIVQGTFLDAYRNMTYKHMMGLKWVAHHCPDAKYILKTDDDVVVHTEAVVNFLIRDLSPWGARNLIICDVSKGAEVLRNDSKWSVTKKEYADDVYPPYCAGM